MNIIPNTVSLAKPRWDGNRVLFEIAVAGSPVPCAISRAALQELWGCRHIAPNDVLRRFTDRRDRIEALAADIFAVRPESATGTLHIWADDIDDPPLSPATAQAAWKMRA